jgi:iron complex outermembrane recepter protein
MTRTLRALFLTGLLGALVLPVSAPPLAGQPPASTPASTIPVADTLPPGDTITPVRVEGVVVTILRSPMQVNRAPFAVSVIQEELGERGRSASSIEEALQGLPGVQVQNRYNAALGEQISIRGFGARSQFGVRGIRILVDGIPATLPDGQASLDHLDLGSLGRVEALRGPGAALYGNAAGGVLHFRSRTPSASPLRQELRFVDGDHGMRRVQATTSGTLGERTYLVSLSRYDWDGFRVLADGSGNTYGSALRDQVNATFTSPLLGGELRVAANYLELDSENPGSLTRADYLLADRRAFPGNVNQRTGKAIRQEQLGFAWAGGIRGREVELALHGIRRDLSNPTPAAIIDLDRVAGGVRALVRSEQEGPAGQLWWAVGFESEFQSDDRLNFANAGGERGVLRIDQKERVSGGAVFVQALLPINRVLDVMTGLRYDRIRFTADDRFPRAPDEPTGTGERTLDSASPSFGLHAAFHRALGAYLNLSTAFETPTTTELTNRPESLGGFNPDLDPQVGITAEVGARGVLGAVAAWEAAFFHTVLYNELVPFEVEAAPGQVYFRNSGRSEREGVELALQFNPDELIRGRVTFSTNRARFRNYAVGDVDYSGNRVPGISPRRVEGLLRIGPGSWSMEVRGEYLASMAANDANDPEAFTSSRRLLDARFALNELNLLGVRVSPFFGITNIGDQLHTSSVAVNAFGGRYFEPGPGRSLYLGGAVAVER